MAITHDDFRHDRRAGIADRRRDNLVRPPAAVPYALAATEGMRVSWGGIWGGVLTAVGLLLLLGALGVAIGITAANPDQPNARMGLIAAAYAGGSLLVALFVGGLVSTRIGAIYDGATGFWEGALVWVVSVLLLGFLTASGVSSLVGGAFSMMGNASQAMGSMMQGGPTTGDAARAVDQAKSRLQDALSSGQIQQKAEALQQKAAQAKPAATRAAWVTFGGFVLSLAAAIGGAMAGRRRRPVPRG